MHRRLQGDDIFFSEVPRTMRTLLSDSCVAHSPQLGSCIDLASGSSARIWDSLYMQLVCRCTLPLSGTPLTRKTAILLPVIEVVSKWRATDAFLWCMHAGTADCCTRCGSALFSATSSAVSSIKMGQKKTQRMCWPTPSTWHSLTLSSRVSPATSYKTAIR